MSGVVSGVNAAAVEWGGVFTDAVSVEGVEGAGSVDEVGPAALLRSLLLLLSQHGAG